MIQVAAKTIASLAMFGSLLFAGVYRCVHAGDDRQRWYCIVCLLWGKRSLSAAEREQVLVNEYDDSNDDSE